MQDQFLNLHFQYWKNWYHFHKIKKNIVFIYFKVNIFKLQILR